MTRTLKVFGVRYTLKGKTTRVIAAARSMKRFAELVRISYGEARKYGSETSNDLEVETAMAKPETVFYYEGNQYAEKPVLLELNR